MEHLSIQQLLMLACRGESPAHVAECAFCREQLDLAADYLAFSEKIALQRMSEMAVSDEVTESVESVNYRLAAQTFDLGPVMFRLRRTWYLNNNSVVLRVIEDMQRKVLTGFLITEQFKSVQARIRFDGIDKEFIPDLNGVFEIGSANIDIEPMQVTVSAC
jgi:hypothetical protein